MWDKCLEARALGARGLGSEFYSFIGQHGKVRQTLEAFGEKKQKKTKKKIYTIARARLAS